MRVYYPVSTKLSELVNEVARTQPYWMTLWGITFIGLLTLLLPALHHFETSATSADFFPKQQNVMLYSKINHQKNVKPIATKAVGTTRLQEYISAHRHEGYFSNHKMMEACRTAQFTARKDIYL